jgi:hypothetical protein
MLTFSFVFAYSVTKAQTGAYVTTDKWNYNSSEGVIVTGTGFAGNEKVILVTTNFYENIPVLENQEVWSNSEGNFTTGSGVANPTITHRLVATGQTSGRSAEVLYNNLPRVNLTATGLPNSEIVKLRISYTDRRKQLVDYPVSFSLAQPLSVIPCYPGTTFRYYEVNNPCTFNFLGIAYGCYDYMGGTPSSPFTVTDQVVTTVTLRFCECPHITSGPTLVTAEAAAGSCSAVVNFTGENAVTATGYEYPEITVSYNPPSGTAFPVGTTMVTAAATNTCGGNTHYYFQVKVTETEPPFFPEGFPTNQTVYTLPDNCYNILEWQKPKAIDNCPGTVTVEQIAGLPSGSQFHVGDNVITYQATDASGNITKQSFTITVIDNQAPVAADVVETVECPQQTNNPTPPVATDNCDGSVSGVFVEGTSTYDPQTCEGTIIRKYSFTDKAGNSSFANHTYIIDRTIPPGEVGEPVSNSGGTIECIADAARPGFYDMPVIKDVCGIPLSYSSGRTEGTYEGCEGTIVYVYTYKDCAGLTYDWKYTYNVVRTTPPHIVPGTEPLLTGKTISCPSEAATPTTPMVEDVCERTLWEPSLTFSGTWEPGDTEGTLIYNYTWTDCAGNSLTWSFTYTIKDEIPPTVIGPSQPIEVDNDAGTCYAEFDLTDLNNFPKGDLKISDNCGGVAQITKIESDWSYESENIRRLSVGGHTIKILVVDASGNETTCEYSLKVVDKDPPVITCPADITVGTNMNCRYVGSVGLATATDLCSRESLISISNDAPPAFEIGATTVTWKATDEAGNIATCEQLVTVTDDDPPVIYCPENITQAADPGLCSASLSFEATATDNCRYSILYSVDGVPITAPHTFTLETTTVDVTATDPAGNTVVCSFTVTVTNTAPVIHSVIPDAALVPKNTSVAISIDYYDNENNITETAIDWGDGTITSIENLSHTYSETGVFPVVVTLTDACGETVTEVYEFIVVYDPSAGFVTGGGWIESPPGAYVADPELTGRANFGFVAKYLKGKNVPEGSTEFQFRAGNLNFKSITYAWLIISGSKAQFKGTGTMNGAGNYGFMLSAVDGNLMTIPATDKFRIKIWDIDAGDVLVYDNEMGVSDSEEATTAISGGAIVIHITKTKSAEIEGPVQSMVEYASLKVYPNPFSSELRFEFMSPETVNAQIDLYDLTGRKVKTIFEGPAEGGVRYNAEFKPNEVVSAMYLYRMTLGEAVYNGKVLYKK